VGRRLFYQSGFRAVAREQLWLIVRNIRELVFEGFGNAGMQRPSRLAQETAVSGVLDERVLEKIACLRRHALPE